MHDLSSVESCAETGVVEHQRAFLTLGARHKSRPQFPIVDSFRGEDVRCFKEARANQAEHTFVTEVEVLSNRFEEEVSACLEREDDFKLITCHQQSPRLLAILPVLRCGFLL